MNIKKIIGQVKNYPWGTKNYLPFLFNYEEDGKNHAEMWFSTHKSGQSILESGESLKNFIDKDIEKNLADVATRFNNDFPLLLKVLSINDPLSIQCHPNEEDAKKGWEKEEDKRNSGVPLNKLIYQDSNQKAEIILALSPLSAMCGFRKYEEIIDNFKSYIPVSYNQYLAKCDSILTLFKTLYSLDEKSIKKVINELLLSLDEENEEMLKEGVYYTKRKIISLAFDLYSYNASLLTPLMLHIIHLKVGEALYLRPSIIHAYVFGNGIELMSKSDNVLRAGLTNKPIYLDELIKIGYFEAEDGLIVKETKDEFNRDVFLTDTKEFHLISLKDNYYEINENLPSLILCINGSVSIKENNEELILTKGECCFVPASSSYSLDVKGSSYQAAVPCSM